jgi:hypothetical protein
MSNKNLATNDRPVNRGFLGHHHTAGAKLRISVKLRRYQAAIRADRETARRLSQLLEHVVLPNGHAGNGLSKLEWKPLWKMQAAWHAYQAD